jgi:hypothetical protein
MDEKHSNKLSGFLQQRLGFQRSKSLEALDRIAGQKFGEAAFYMDLDETRSNLRTWMPLFFLPVATVTFPTGLHLRPSDVAAGRLAFIRSEDGPEFIEIAGSLEQLVYLALLGQEAYGNYQDRVVPSFYDSVAKANRVFGEQFYEKGLHGRFLSDEVARVMIEAFGGTSEAFDFIAVFAETPAEQFKWYERGITIEPNCLHLYAGAVKAMIELNDHRGAAERFARSLDCYHHTAYSTDLAQYFELGRSLMKEFPDLFSEDARWALGEPDPRNWARRAGELFNAGEVERADKILNDMCYGIRDYSGAIGAFRKHYEKLGWEWALALCELRSK